MPIDINLLRADKGGNPELWREMTRKRFKPVELVDTVIELDEVRPDRSGECCAEGGAASWREVEARRKECSRAALLGCLGRRFLHG